MDTSLDNRGIYFIIFIFFLSDSMLVKQNSSLLINQSSNILILFITMYLIISRVIKSSKFTVNQVFYGVFVPLTILMSTLINYWRFDLLSAGAFIKIILIIFGLLISERIEFRRFRNCYIKSVSILSILSLIPYLVSLFFWPIVGNIISSFPILSRQGYMTFYSLFFTNIPTYVSDRWRNWSIFSEPGEFQIYLILALLFLLFLPNDTNNKKGTFIVLSLAIFSTLSTTAYILYGWILLVYFFASIRNKIAYKEIVVTALIILIVIVLLQQDKLVEVVFGKLSGGLSNRSFGDRFYSIKFNFEIIKQYPLLGVGPGYFSRIQNEVDYISAVTNTLLGTFSMYGFVAGIAYFRLIIKFSIKYSKNIFIFICLITTFFIMLFTQEMTYSPLINTLFFWGISQLNINK